MRAINEVTITDAALEQMSSTPSPRLREIMASLVRHLHTFAREVDLTPAEWLEGIRFLTAVGQKCTEHRQEFILLSDTLGLSALPTRCTTSAPPRPPQNPACSAPSIARTRP